MISCFSFRPRLEEGFPISASQLCPSTTVFQQAAGRLFVRLWASFFHLISWRSQRSVGELLISGMWNSSSMHSTCEASTPQLYPSFVFTRVCPKYRVGFVVTSLFSSSRSRLKSVRISLMIWCVPAIDKSSTWNSSDTRFVVCPQASVQHVWDEAALPEDLLEMVLPASRGASQAIKTFL